MKWNLTFPAFQWIRKESKKDRKVQGKREKKELKRGVLIVFEGIDGSGKSTQAEILLRNLLEKGYDAVLFQEPTTGEWGCEIKKKALYPDSLSPEEELKLFLLDRRENVNQNLKPAMEQKKVVLLDRYYYSTIAYQGAKGIEPSRIKKLNEKFAPKADLVFILNVDAKTGLDRIKTRKKKYKLFEREDYLIKVSEIFKEFKGKEFIHLDALQTPEELSRQIEETVLQLLEEISQ